MPSITFTTPMPPSVNSLYASVPNRRVKGTSYRSWLGEAGWLLAAQRVKPLPFGPDLIVEITCGPRIKNADIANREKALLDLTVSAGLIRDDSDVVSLKIAWGPVDGAVVVISTVEPA